MESKILSSYSAQWNVVNIKWMLHNKYKFTKNCSVLPKGKYH
jgi:hypothetical protein